MYLTTLSCHLRLWYSGSNCRQQTACNTRQTFPSSEGCEVVEHIECSTEHESLR